MSTIRNISKRGSVSIAKWPSTASTRSDVAWLNPLSSFSARPVIVSLERFPDLLPELGDAPRVPSVGDAHIENWGTWRDAEGRLVWGVNDFDDAAILPYTYDLLRLATSALLSGEVPNSPQQQAAEILRGYRKGLSKPGAQIVDIDISWMREVAQRRSASPKEFWHDLHKDDDVGPTGGGRRSAARPVSARVLGHRLIAGPAGEAEALGRPRFAASGFWRGGAIAREAKALVPSSWDWAAKRADSAPLFLNLANGRYRSPDPFLNLRSGDIIRRIAPDSQKLIWVTPSYKPRLSPGFTPWAGTWRRSI